MTILITTPNGTVGRYLAAGLADRADVRYLVRSDSGKRRLGPVRGEVVVGDATDPEAARRAVAGVERMYLAHPFAVDQVEAETRLGLAAVRAGVRRIVKLGARPFPQGNTDAVTGAHDVVVERLRAAGVPELTVLRPDRFLQNFLAAAPAIAAGELADPAGPGARGYLDARDIAEVALAELLADRPAGGAIDLSGPGALSVGELAQVFGSALGRPVRYREVPLDDRWRAGLAQVGVPGEVIDGLAGLYRNYRAEGVAGLGDGVQRVLGRAPRTAGEFAADEFAPAARAARVDTMSS